MTIRRMLVPVAGQEQDKAVLETAFLAAKSMNAHIDAVFVKGEPTEFVPILGEGYSGMVAQDVIEAMDKASTELAAKAKETVSWLAKEKDIPLLDHIERREGATVSFARVSGPVFQVLQNESLLTDLVVYAHMGAPLNNQLKSVQADLLIGCRRPFLIAPEEAPASIGSKIVIGFDGSTESASAIRQARGFLNITDEVEIVMIGEDEEELKERAQGPIDYLACHDVHADMRIIPGNASNVGDALLAAAHDMGADLLVVGGYGHSRVREFIFGGTTRQVLSEAKIPVLMAH